MNNSISENASTSFQDINSKLEQIKKQANNSDSLEIKNLYGDALHATIIANKSAKNLVMAEKVLDKVSTKISNYTNNNDIVSQYIDLCMENFKEIFSSKDSMLPEQISEYNSLYKLFSGVHSLGTQELKVDALTDIFDKTESLRKNLSNKELTYK